MSVPELPRPAQPLYVGPGLFVALAQALVLNS